MKYDEIELGQPYFNSGEETYLTFLRYAFDGDVALGLDSISLPDADSFGRISVNRKDWEDGNVFSWSKSEKSFDVNRSLIEFIFSDVFPRQLKIIDDFGE